MDVPTRQQGSLCQSDCHHLFRRAKIAFDAGAPKIAQTRVSEGLSAINNCRVHEVRRQAPASTDEEIACEDAEGPTEHPGEPDLDAAASGVSDRFAEFLAEFGRLLEAEQERRTTPELAAFRLALLVEIGDVGGVVRP
jgi:hypothetical protein